MWLDVLSAMWNGFKDARSNLPQDEGPVPYYHRMATKGQRRASTIKHAFWREDLKNKPAWLAAENRQHQAELELGHLRNEAGEAQTRYLTERDRDAEETRSLNPPGRAYIPVSLYWLLLALLIGGDAAITYSAFLTVIDVPQQALFVALTLMVVVSMVVIGHVIGDRLRHGALNGRAKFAMYALVILISVTMTLFRETAQVAAQEAQAGATIEAITIGSPNAPAAAPAQPAPAPATASATITLPAASAFLMFLIVTAMGIAVPAILAYYVERRPHALRLLQAYRGARWAGTRLKLGRIRFYRANRSVARTKAYRLSRHVATRARLDESKDHICHLIATYAHTNLRARKTQESLPSLQAYPQVPGSEILGELDWTYPEAQRGPTYWGKTPGDF